MATDGVAQLRAIADQPVTYADQHQGRLLLSRLDRHEAHCRPAHRLAKRFRVRRIVLAALQVRLDELRRDQLHRMPERLQQPRTVVACTAGFDRDHRRRKLLEECQHLLASQLLAQNLLLGGVHSVKLENVFRRIHTNSANLFHGRSPLSEIYNDLILARLMPSGAVHTNRRLIYPSFADSAPRCRAMNRPYTHGTILGLCRLGNLSVPFPAVAPVVGGGSILKWVPSGEVAPKYVWGN